MFVAHTLIIHSQCANSFVAYSVITHYVCAKSFVAYSVITHMLCVCQFICGFFGDNTLCVCQVIWRTHIDNVFTVCQLICGSYSDNIFCVCQVIWFVAYIVLTHSLCCKSFYQLLFIVIKSRACWWILVCSYLNSLISEFYLIYFILLFSCPRGFSGYRCFHSSTNRADSRYLDSLCMLHVFNLYVE